MIRFTYVQEVEVKGDITSYSIYILYAALLCFMGSNNCLVIKSLAHVESNFFFFNFSFSLLKFEQPLQEADLAKLEENVKPTWSEVVEPMERIVDKLSVAWGVVNHLKSVKDSSEFRSAVEAIQVINSLNHVKL